MKCCVACKAVKPLTNFGALAKSKDKLSRYCKECCNRRAKKWRDENPERAKAQAGRSREKNGGKRLAGLRLRYTSFEEFVRRLKSKYKMTIEQYDEMMLNQGGMCAICDRDAKLVIDHNHETGKVRALLCNNCNCAIGHLKESADLAIKAAEYLKKHKVI